MAKQARQTMQVNILKPRPQLLGKQLLIFHQSSLRRRCLRAAWPAADLLLICFKWTRGGQKAEPHPLHSRRLCLPVDVPASVWVSVRGECEWRHVYASLAPLSYGQHVTFTNNKDNEKYTGERLALRAARHCHCHCYCLLLLLLLPSDSYCVALVALVLT